MTVEGVDVSSCQAIGSLDWERIYAAGRRFAFVKTSEGEWHDPSYAKHVTGARAAGLLVSAYHFARLSGDPVRQASAYCNGLGTIDLPPVLDLEGESERNCAGWNGHGSTMPRAEIVQWCEAWLAEIDCLLKVRGILYSYPGYLNTLRVPSDSSLSQRELWVAHYGVKAPMAVAPWGNNWTCWQYAGNDGRIDGSKGPIDCNVFRGTEEDLRGWHERSKIVDVLPTLQTQPVEWGPRTAEQVLPEVFPRGPT